jgi:hypothetical protein
MTDPLLARTAAAIDLRPAGIWASAVRAFEAAMGQPEAVFVPTGCMVGPDGYCSPLVSTRVLNRNPNPLVLSYKASCDAASGISARLYCVALLESLHAARPRHRLVGRCRLSL